MPAEAKGTSEAAAKAFVRHWIDVLNYAGPAADAEALRQVSHPDCAACNAIADFIEKTAGAGGEIKGDGWSVRTLELVTLDEHESAVIDVEAAVSPQQVRTDSDSNIRTFAGGRRVKTFWLVSSEGAWRVTRLDQPE
jgi:hypothetical protein